LISLLQYIFIIYYIMFIMVKKYFNITALREKSDKPISPNNKEMVDILKVMRDTMRFLDFCLDGANQKCEDFGNI